MTRLGGWLGRARAAAGIRPVDVGATAAVLAAVEINVVTGGGPGAQPLTALAYLTGAVLVLPVLLRHRWPLRELIGCSVLLLIYYVFYRRDISPAPLLCLPLYDAALAGYLATAIVIPVCYMTVGLFVVDLSTHESLVRLASDFLPSLVVLALAIMLGDAVRSRRVLAAETADRLRLAEEERDAEAARRVAEERLRIARELHDTVAHGMATITVQAGSALHVLGTGGPARLRAALVAIRETSKGALADMRVTLGQLRGGGADVEGDETRAAGLDRLEALSDAVRAAGAPVTVSIEGERVPLPFDVDHAAYRILQESLTNVLRHAGPTASATVCLQFARGELAIHVTDDGSAGSAPDSRVGPAPDGLAGSNGGHGLTGMAERAAAVGGQLTAGPRPGGGFEVLARLPVARAGAAG